MGALAKECNEQRSCSIYVRGAISLQFNGVAVLTVAQGVLESGKLLLLRL